MILDRQGGDGDFDAHPASGKPSGYNGQTPSRRSGLAESFICQESTDTMK